MNRNLKLLKLNSKNFLNQLKWTHSYNKIVTPAAPHIIISNNNTKKIKWPTNEVRKSYLDHFCNKHKHKFIYSSSVIPRKGSGTYFTNAGMNQFKSIILGELNSNDIIDYNKYIGVANSQKCIRIGGKHSDLDTIGKDDNHHTFFEMLGNWSFGTYNKNEACRYALELLIDTYKLDMKRLYFTYFSGNKEFNLEADTETRDIWKSLGVPEHNIIASSMADNFWEMDVHGPCGPCTEIHYDRSLNGDSLHLLNKGDERVIELWNIVFMQYNRLSKTSFINLPQLVIDTGMGLERMSAVLNNLNSNYEIDVFTPIFKQIETYLKNININLPPFNECISNNELKYGYRTLADHMRSITIAISDGLLPTRGGLGSYLKYLIFKCMRLSQEIFQINSNQSQFLVSLVPIIVNTLKDAYPQLEADCERIQEVIKNTELKQQAKIKRSEEITKRFMHKLNNPKSLGGDEIWTLYKGDGTGEDVPIEFIENYARKNSVKLDREGFDKIYVDETEKALKNLKNVRTENTQLINICTQIKRDHHLPSTNDSFKYNFELDTNFHIARYKDDDFISKILCLVRVNDDETYEIVDHINMDEKCIVVLDHTNFYSEKGGQHADNGILSLLKDTKMHIKVTHVEHVLDYVLHFGKFKCDNSELKNFKLNKHDFVNCKIDQKRRYQTTLNHTGIHLLNHALRKYYNDENSILQISSNSKDTHLKFEYSLNKAVKFEKPSVEDIENIEKICQNLIDSSLNIYENTIEYDRVEDINNSNNVKIRKLRDVLYPKTVRVISVGDTLDNLIIKNGSNNLYSSELCCGTHAENTSNLENFLITHVNQNSGDFMYELEACVAKRANEILNNERIIDEIYQEICELNPLSMHGSHEIARKCIQIEMLQQHWRLSYKFKNRLMKNLEKYRPSKYKLEKHLHDYFNEQILGDEMIDAESLYLKLINFNSILPHEQTIRALKKIAHIPNSLILFNKFRKYLVIYSYENTEKDTDIELHNRLFDTIESLFSSNHVDYEKIHSSHSNIKVYKFSQRTKPEQVIEICKNIEKI